MNSLPYKLPRSTELKRHDSNKSHEEAYCTTHHQRAAHLILSYIVGWLGGGGIQPDSVLGPEMLAVDTLSACQLSLSKLICFKCGDLVTTCDNVLSCSFIFSQRACGCPHGNWLVITRQRLRAISTLICLCLHRWSTPSLLCLVSLKLLLFFILCGSSPFVLLVRLSAAPSRSNFPEMPHADSLKEFDLSQTLK